MQQQALWYLTRSSGVVALILATTTMVLGIVTWSRAATPRWPRFVSAGLHRQLSLFSTVFLTLHIVTAVADRYTPLSLLDAIVPGHSAYRPIWIGFGALALDLTIALIASSLMQKRLDYRRWRAVHWLAYALWPTVIVHALGSGSDMHAAWMQLLLVASVGSVAIALTWRITAAGRPLGSRVATGLACLAALLVVGGWSVQGPLRAGWARKAGTPVVLLEARAAVGTAASGFRARELTTRARAAGVPALGIAALPLQDRYLGTVNLDQTGDGLVSLQLNGRLNGHPTTRLTLVVAGEVSRNGGLLPEQAKFAIGNARLPSLYQGDVKLGADGMLRGTLSPVLGGPPLAVSLSVSGSDTQATGIISLR